MIAMRDLFPLSSSKMKSALIALFALFTVASSADTAVPELRFVASFPFKKPAFVTAHRNPKNMSHYGW